MREGQAPVKRIKKKKEKRGMGTRFKVVKLNKCLMGAP